MAASPTDSETLPFASRLADLSARQDVADDERWEQVASTARNLADRLRTREGEVDEHSALGQTPLPRTLTALINEALAAPSVPSGPALLAVYELLRTSANFCMDHDDNRQLLLAASFPQSVVSLLHRYSAIQVEPSRTMPVSLMELKILKTTAGVILNTSLYFDPIRDYFISAGIPETLLRLQTRIYPPCSWSVIHYNQNESFNIKEEWTWRSGFFNWASLALSELFRDNDKSRILPVELLGPLIDVLTKFTPPFPTPSGLLVEDPTTRHTLISADVDLLNDVSSLLESLALDSEDVQVFLAQTAACDPLHEGNLIKYILDFVEFGDYPPYWSRETPSERVKREKAFDMCKAAIIKTVVEVTGALRCIDILWDLNQPNGWFVMRLIRWIQSNITTSRDDLVVCATLCLGNLARRESHCIALVQPPFSLIKELASLLDVQVDIKLKHGTLGLLKHLSQSPTNRATLVEAGILNKLTKSEIWFEKSDMAEIVQSSAIGTAKHLCTANFENAVQLTVSRANANPLSPTGVDQILALVKRSDTVAVKSEGTRVIVNVIKSLCSHPQADEMELEQRRKAIELVTSSASAIALTELVGRSRKYPVLISEGIVALTLLSLQPSGSPLVARALLAPLTLEPVSTASRSTSQSSQASPISSPATCLTMLHNILSDTDDIFPAELRVNACSLLGSVARQGPDNATDAIFLRENSGPILASLARALPVELDGRVRQAAQKALEAWK